MSKIKSKNTKPEIYLRSWLHRQGFRFRIHHKDLPGKPDIVLPKYRTVIFVHGCFWHYHVACNEGRIPDTNSKFWRTKLSKNIDRDLKYQAALQTLGFQVAVIWECELEGKARREETLSNLLKMIKSHE